MKIVSAYLFWQGLFFFHLAVMFGQYQAKDHLQMQGGTDSLCKCKALLHEYKGQFVPSLGNFATYEKYRQLCAWEPVGGEEYFKKVYVDKMIFNVGHTETFYQFSLVSYPPVRLHHPKNAYTLNLNPCEPGSKVHELPVALNVTQALTAHMPPFEEGRFDSTAEAYFDVLAYVSGQYEESLLETRLTAMLNSDQAEDYSRLNQFISKLDSNYKIGLHAVTPENYTENTIPDLLTQLKNAETDIKTILLDEFVKEKKDRHTITRLEKSRLQDLFSGYFNHLNLDEFEQDFLKAHYRLVLPETKFIGIEIESRILRQWDSEKKTALVDSNGHGVNASVLLFVNEPQYTSKTDQWTIEASHACLQPSEIGNSGFLLDFSKAHLISPQSNAIMTGFSISNYPMFIRDTTENTDFWGEPKTNLYVYDTLITAFEGLYVPEAHLNLELGKKKMDLKLTELLLNNYLLCGQLELQVEKKSKAGHVNIIHSGQTISIELNKLRSTLSKAGFELGAWQWVPNPTQNETHTKSTEHTKKKQKELWRVSCDFWKRT